MTAQTPGDTIVPMTTLAEYLAIDGWTLLEPLRKRGGAEFRATKDGSIVQAVSHAELCKRIWDIERGIVRTPRTTDDTN